MAPQRLSASQATLLTFPQNQELRRISINMGILDVYVPSVPPKDSSTNHVASFRPHFLFSLILSVTIEIDNLRTNVDCKG